MPGTFNQTITTEQDVFGGVNQLGATSGDYSAIYNATELMNALSLGSTVNTNAFTISGAGGVTGKYTISAFPTDGPVNWQGGSAVLMTGATTIAPFGPTAAQGSVTQALAAGTYFWQLTAGNAAPTEPTAGFPHQPYTGIPVGLKLLVNPV